MTNFDDIIDAKEIACILGFSTPEAAANLCRSGRLKSAIKKGNVWLAQKEEVLAYKSTMRQWSTQKSKQYPESTC